MHNPIYVQCIRGNELQREGPMSLFIMSIAACSFIKVSSCSTKLPGLCSDAKARTQSSRASDSFFTACRDKSTMLSVILPLEESATIVTRLPVT